MATLKSIKNKYLQYSDGATLGVDVNADNAALLGFRVASAGSFSVFNMTDGVSDNFQDSAGINTGSSTNATRDGSGFTAGVSGKSGNTDLTAFTSSGQFAVQAVVSLVDVLVVAGGSGGGHQGGSGGGGGGAGGYVYRPGFAVTPSTQVAVGVGAGAGGTGQDSTFGTLTAKGGGHGSQHPQEAGSGGGAGGSGGGGGWIGGGGGAGTQPSQPGDSGTYGFGNPGGSAGGGGNYACGSGGGAGAAGAPPSGGRGAAGGVGKEATQFTSYGASSGHFAGGGTGTGQGGHHTGGTGGGGTLSTAGTANTGGGGGGGQGSGGGSGGSGFVGVKNQLGYADMTLISTAVTAAAAPSYADFVILYTDAAGTATLNTDIKLYVARNGSDYTIATTLVDGGTTGASKVAISRNINLTGETSGTSMVYKITTHNQSVLKSTTVNGTSFAWRV